MPLLFSTLKPRWIFGLRMSRSRITTFFPEKAITPARLIALKVFPSPEIVEVTPTGKLQRLPILEFYQPGAGRSEFHVYTWE
jgi:hypothetical protein